MDQLESHIHALKDAHAKLQNLRHLPQHLLRPVGGPNVLDMFHMLKGFSDEIASPIIQDALKSATDSEKADKAELEPQRREIRKRRRAPSPESPQPYVAPVPDSKEPEEMEPIGNLEKYVRGFNQTRSLSRLDIWRATRNNNDKNGPEILRFVIRDVLTAYIVLARTEAVESVTAFGPRERKWPHSQSEYLVYQNLSQQLAKTIHSQDHHISLPRMLVILEAYQGLFIDPCNSCGRVLSAEGHVPPVVRVLRDGSFVAKHIACR